MNRRMGRAVLPHAAELRRLEPGFAVDEIGLGKKLTHRFRVIEVARQGK